MPGSLHDTLMARLDRLTPVKEVAQIGAVIGREFSHELIAAVSPLPKDHLDDALDRLVASELVFRRGAPPDCEIHLQACPRPGRGVSAAAQIPPPAAAR